MKSIIIILSILLVSSTAYAGVALVKGTEFARIGASSDAISVYKVLDGETTCYVTNHGKFGAHAISCVK